MISKLFKHFTSLFTKSSQQNSQSYTFAQKLVSTWISQSYFEGQEARQVIATQLKRRTLNPKAPPCTTNAPLEYFAIKSTPSSAWAQHKTDENMNFIMKSWEIKWEKNLPKWQTPVASLSLPAVYLVFQSSSVSFANPPRVGWVFNPGLAEVWTPEAEAQ